MENNIKNHESYGMLSISRVQHSREAALFGSDLCHRNTIELTIGKGKLIRHSNEDWFSSNEELIRVKLSPTQWAEAITSMNTNGVPCTIVKLNGKMVDECPFISKSDTIRKEYSDELFKISKKSNRLSAEIVEKLQNKKNINKGDREEIIKLIRELSSQINFNLPFIAKQCNRQLSKAIAEAKGEIEGYILNRGNSLELEALEEEIKNILVLEDRGEVKSNL